MTPLARQIVENLITMPKARRRPSLDLADVAHKMADVHCFDLSAVWEIVEDLADQMIEEYKETGKLKSAELSFVPAPKTFIEFGLPGRQFRTGYLLISDESCRADAHVIVCQNFIKQKALRPVIEQEDLVDDDHVAYLGITSFPSGILPLLNDRPPQPDLDREFYEALERSGPGDPTVRNNLIEGSKEKQFDLNFILYASLALINSPRVIDRRQHTASSSLARKLLGQRRLIGSFPLHAWTELKLEVRPPEDMIASGEYEAHLTGHKCLHFCRAHLRVRCGQLEIVKGHWRGDPALGMKQTRYSVVPPRHQW